MQKETVSRVVDKNSTTEQPMQTGFSKGVVFQTNSDT